MEEEGMLVLQEDWDPEELYRRSLVRTIIMG